MGLQDVFFTLSLPFDSPEARELSRKIQEEIYFHALNTSADLAEQFDPHPAFPETRAAQGDIQIRFLEGLRPTDSERWERLRDRISAPV